MKTIAILFRPPRRSGFIVVLIVGLLAGVGAWYSGLDPVHAVGVGAALLVAGIVWIAARDLDAAEWDKPVATANAGGRQDIVHLSWVLKSRRDWVGDGAQRRVRDIARRRLAHLGLDLDAPDDAPAIEKLVGLESYAILRPWRTRQASLPALARALHELDRLQGRRPAGVTTGLRHSPGPGTDNNERK